MGRRKSKTASEFRLPRLEEPSAEGAGVLLRPCGVFDSIAIVDQAAPSKLPPPSLKSGIDSFEVPPLKPSRARTRDGVDTAGADWGGMEAPKLTPELKRELQLVRMRGAFDPKRFYRASDMGKELPKYFQIGTLHEDTTLGGAPKARRASILQEHMSDLKLRRRAKRQFHKVQEATSAGVRRNATKKFQGNRKMKKGRR